MGFWDLTSIPQAYTHALNLAVQTPTLTSSITVEKQNPIDSMQSSQAEMLGPLLEALLLCCLVRSHMIHGYHQVLQRKENGRSLGRCSPAAREFLMCRWITGLPYLLVLFLWLSAHPCEFMLCVIWKLLASENPITGSFGVFLFLSLFSFSNHNSHISLVQIHNRPFFTADSDSWCGTWEESLSVENAPQLFKAKGPDTFKPEPVTTFCCQDCPVAVLDSRSLIFFS